MEETQYVEVRGHNVMFYDDSKYTIKSKEQPPRKCPHCGSILKQGKNSKYCNNDNAHPLISYWEEEITIKDGID